LRFEEQVEVGAARARVWNLIWDVPRVAACVPGCTDAVEVEPGRRYTALIEQRMGPFRSRFNMNMRTVEVEEPVRVVIAAQGDDRSTASYVTIELTLELHDSEASTALAVTADVTILGKLGGLGQGMIRRKASEVVGEFAQSLGKALV
jgi:carbon monoxide dehydrogenase subunit G